MAGISSGIGASQMTKGSVDVSMTYDETTVATTLNSGNNINIKTGNDTTMISTELNAANNITADIGGELFVGTAQEQHQSYESHETFGGDVGMAALGGAMTGLMSGLGMQSGMFIGGELLGLTLSGASAFGASNVGAALSENRNGTSSGTYTTNQISSVVVANNDISLVSNKDLTIVGSDILSGNNTTLQSNNGTVNILAAIETIINIESTIKTNWGGMDFAHTNSSVGVSASL